LAAVLAASVSSVTADDFALPDLQRRVIVGSGNGNLLSPRAVGSSFGEETHILSVAETPSHSHDVSDPGHSHVIAPEGQNIEIGSVGSSTIFAISQCSPSPCPVPNTGLTDTSTTNIQIGNNGGNQSHNNMQPSLVLNYIIKYWLGGWGEGGGGSVQVQAFGLRQFTHFSHDGGWSENLFQILLRLAH
jgi:microcystin-dependent protein